MNLGLRTCVYTVSDMEAAKAWYAEVFKTEAYFDEPYYIGFSIGGYELGLLPDPEPEKEKTANVNVYWGVENAYQAFERLLAMGASVQEEPKDVGEGIILATVRDPWGNVLGVIDNQHFQLPGQD
ncbi:MAG: VOC family protein [Bacteroidota bacterium]